MTKGITLQELDALTINRLIVKDTSGRAKVAAPAASDDIALKSTVDNAVGTLSSLLTTAKGNTVAAINELFTNVGNGKTSVAAAITGKGVAASGSDTFSQLADKIGQIMTGIKVASGSFSPAISGHVSNPPTGTITNLSFTPKVLILFGFIRLYSVPGPIDVHTYGHLIAYNVDGTLVIGSSILDDMREPNRDNSSFNIETVNFGANSLSFALKVNSNSSYGASVTVSKYIVFGN
ncbi:hypothetical protein [Fontibacillus sp. BL9]|uniref:hypothetical protein n=1 Tax=Fontibacillus sp. BL9 TaxID=3389971 RepID=UPI00397B85EC